MSSGEDSAPDIGSKTHARDNVKNIKRSCSNCRQQKLKCDVIQSPFKACSRCRRLQKECKVERGFKRVGKRDKYASMQREIDDLHRQLKIATKTNASGAGRLVLENPARDQLSESISSTKSRQLGDTGISGLIVDSLYKEYFTHYHPYLPLLDPEPSPDEYFDLSPLLGWTIIIVAARRFSHDPPLLTALASNYNKLLWSSISEGPQSYHVVKSLSLICTWPLPTTTNPSDNTFSLSSMMVSIALQNALDFPVQLQFSKGHITELEQRDRRLTWAACNIVAQCTASAYGFHSHASLERLLGSDFALLNPYNIHKDLIDQLRVVQLFNSLNKTLYEGVLDVSGLASEHLRLDIYKDAKKLYSDAAKVLESKVSMNTEIMLLAANIHLNSFAFFIQSSPARETGLVSLFYAACTFIHKVLDFETSTGTLLEHCTNIILQSFFSAMCALVKLLHSTLSPSINADHGNALFNAAILAVRRMSLRNDDVCARMVIRIPQLARDMSPGGFWETAQHDPLELKIRARMCANHNYDCMWHWLTARRQEAQAKDAAANPPPIQKQGKRVQDQVDLQLSRGGLSSFEATGGIVGEDLDWCNSMDWFMSDFNLAGYDFSAGTL